jgi:hypothetical protein
MSELLLFDAISKWKSGDPMQRWWAFRELEKKDIAAAALLFFATAGFVLWQNSQVAVLWDLGYLLDSSHRIALGQVPYRDFPFVHPPLTFLIQAAIQRFVGRSYLYVIYYAALIGGLGTVITWRIVFGVLKDRLARAWTISLLLAGPLVFLGIQGIYPHPIYDCDCVFWVLVALLMLQRLDSRTASQGAGAGAVRGWLRPALAGIAVVIPLFFKQNIGLAFLLIVIAGLLLLLVIPRRNSKESSAWPEKVKIVRVLVAIGFTLIAAGLAIQVWAGLGKYLYWTIQFAAQQRLHGFSSILAIYHHRSLALILPAPVAGLLLLLSRYASRLWCRALVFCLFSAPFLVVLALLFLQDDLEDRTTSLLVLWPLMLVLSAIVALVSLRRGITLELLLPFFVLAAIHGTFLSQELWGSTYAIWPLLVLLIAGVLASLSRLFERVTPAIGSAFVFGIGLVISATLLICGSLYAIGHERLSYIQLPEGPISRATLPVLRGMSAPGPFLPNFEELVRFSAHEIPWEDGILLFPGEDPFYYATGRTPKMPVLLFTGTTDPYSVAELEKQLIDCNIRWVIMETHVQLNDDSPPQRDELLDFVAREYKLYRRLGGYDVYRH